MTLNNDILDKNIEYSIKLNRLDYSKDIQKLLSQLEAELIAKIATARLTTFQAKRTQNLLKFIKNAINVKYIDLSNVVNLLDIADLEVDFWKKTIGVQLLTSVPTKTQLKALGTAKIVNGKAWKDWWKEQAADLQYKFSNAIRLGIASGEDNNKIVQRIRGTREFSYKNGIMELTRKNAQALVRTGLQTVSTETRDALFKQNSKVIKAIMQVSTLDTRTSQICIAYSGKKWDLDYKPIGHKLPYNGGPPRHFNCRSTIIPITKSFDELGIKVPSEERSRLDGKVPDDIKFDEWLKAKPQSTVDKLLGKGKAELFLDGKLNLSDLVKPDGTTVKTLKEFYSLDN